MSAIRQITKELPRTVFYIDVDNTLLDNDHIKDEIKKSLIKVLGEREAIHFWQHHDEFRSQKKLVDFPNIIHAYCAEMHKDTCDLTLNRIFESIEFSHALYPEAINVIQHLKELGKVILFTEGDSVYQRRKLDQSGLAKMADGVELYEHKLEHLDEVLKKYGGNKIVFIDDRAESLSKIKNQFPEVFTVEVCQGHYAAVDHKIHETMDKVINSISELHTLKQSDLHHSNL